MNPLVLCRRHRLAFTRILFCVWLGWLLSVQGIWAEEPVAEPADPAVKQSQPAETTQPPADAAAAANKKKKASAGLAAIVGIVIVGIGAIAAIMMSASHFRRLARDPGPAQTTLGNDFWFLKPPKSSPPSTSENVTPPETDETTP